MLPPLLDPSRVAPTVAHRENDYFFTANDVIDGVGIESVQSDTSGIAKLNSRCFGVVSNIFDRDIKGIQKPQTQAGLLVFIPAGSLRCIKFGGQNFSENVFHGAVPESDP